MTTITALGVGSGLDLNGLLDQLQQGENERLTPITQQQTSYQTKISALGTVTSALTNLQNAVQPLGLDASYQAVQGNVTGSAVTASTTSGTPIGTYRIHVTQRAEASSVATLGVADSKANLGAGTINVQLAGGKTLSVTMDAAHSSLENIRDAINAQNGGVQASLINDGSGTPWRLALTSIATGSAASIASVDFGSLAPVLQLDAAASVAGQDAQLTVNGVAIQSPGNSISGAIQGATLNVATAGDATLDVSRDGTAIKSAVSAFVNQYNALVATMRPLTAYNMDTQTAGVLLGDSAARSVQSRLSGIASNVVTNGGAFHTLSDLGITLQLDGTLQVDDTKLTQAISQDPDSVHQFFVGTPSQPGMAGQISTAINGMIGFGGSLSADTGGLNASLQSLNQQYQDVQAQIAATMANYRQQFSQLDGLVASMNATSTYLTQQFDALGKISASGK